MLTTEEDCLVQVKSSFSLKDKEFPRRVELDNRALATGEIPSREMSEPNWSNSNDKKREMGILRTADLDLEDDGVPIATLAVLGAVEDLPWSRVPEDLTEPAPSGIGWDLALLCL